MQISCHDYKTMNDGCKLSVILLLLHLLEFTFYSAQVGEKLCSKGKNCLPFGSFHS